MTGKLISGWLLILVVVILGVAGCQPELPSRASSPTVVVLATIAIESATPTSTLYPTRTPEPTPTASPTVTGVPTITPTATPLPVPTATPRPLPTPDGVERTIKVPILMYHYISAPPADADAVRLDLSLPPEKFEEQLIWLRDNGYETITFDDLILALQTGAALPPKPILLTLDDGYRDAYTNAYPLLLKYGMKATVFVITRLLDENNINFVTWDMAAEMSKHGISIESHTINHYDLSTLPEDRIVRELQESRTAIEAHTGQQVRILCYPSGAYNGEVIRLLPAAGYWAGTTTAQGIYHSNTNLWELSRVRIRGYFGAEQLLEMLNYFDEP
ncbi:MAG: polysaccharide deacetylase family protein [Anaerolineae bacterium]